jgi:transposase-like protein
MSMSAVSRKYGVSDNAVRKWLRWHERERERQASEQGQAGEGDSAQAA